jgi:VIT1/CCC1 family predicted Fe2+/Mn2+ transporter
MTRSPEHPAYHEAEREHREDTGSGVLRASVFGASDGLVSNLALVMGVAGGTSDAATVVLAGTAGLLAGAFSMAAGEYVSMVTQRESMERQLELERQHIEQYPDEERRHFTELLVESGLPRDTAVQVSRSIHQRVEPAADFHALLELGIVPGQMGAPVGAAAASFVAFMAGAVIPLLPWLVFSDAFVSSIVISAVALLVVGGAVTRVTNRSMVSGALRQLVFGGAAAAVTWWIGRMIGANV